MTVMTPSPLAEAARAFIEALPAEKGYSVHTCRAYSRDLEEFTAYLTENGRPSAGACAPEGSLGPQDITAVAIRGYLGMLHQKNQKSSIARKLSTLRSFFKFLVKKGVVDANPVEGILTPKREKNLPGYLSIDTVFHLLDSIEPDSVLAARNRAIFEAGRAERARHRPRRRHLEGARQGRPGAHRPGGAQGARGHRPLPGGAAGG
jgi:integrase/recombinase XerC